MQPFHTHGIQLLEFSPNGSKLLTVGQGPHNTVAVYDWTNSIVSTQCRTGTSRIKSASWENEQEFTIVSDYDPHKRSSNTKFYRIQGKNLSLKVGERLGSENVKPAGSKDEDKQEDLDFNTVVTHAQVSKTLRFCVTGTKKGYLYFWHDPQGKDKTKEKGSMTKVHRQILERKTKKDAAGKAIDSDRDWQDDECQKHRYGGVTCLSYLDNESKFIIGTDKGYVLSLDYVFDVNQEDITKQDCLDFSKLTEYKGPESFNNKPILSLQYLRGNGKSKERLLVATGEQRVVEYSANEMHEFAEDEKSSNSLGVKELVNGHDQSAVKSKSSEGQTKRE
jgi:WD40 repeat protein